MKFTTKAIHVGQGADPATGWLDGCGVTLTGTGTFPGATGTAGGAFTATYANFLAPFPQDVSYATSASYQP